VGEKIPSGYKNTHPKDRNVIPQVNTMFPVKHWGVFQILYIPEGEVGMIIRNRRVREAVQRYNADGVKLDSPEVVANIVKSVLLSMDKQDRDKEIFFSIGLNVKLQVKYIEIVSMGVLNASLVSPRELFRTAFIRGGVSNIIIVHNHPSGDTTPSLDDIKITHTLRDAGDLLDIHVIDHIIVSTNGEYFSFKANGLMDKR
jgi:DNA repair protein RadC